MGNGINARGLSITTSRIVPLNRYVAGTVCCSRAATSRLARLDQFACGLTVQEFLPHPKLELVEPIPHQHHDRAHRSIARTRQKGIREFRVSWWKLIPLRGPQHRKARLHHIVRSSVLICRSKRSRGNAQRRYRPVDFFGVDENAGRKMLASSQLVVRSAQGLANRVCYRLAIRAFHDFGVMRPFQQPRCS